MTPITRKHWPCQPCDVILSFMAPAALPSGKLQCGTQRFQPDNAADYHQSALRSRPAPPSHAQQDVAHFALTCHLPKYWTNTYYGGSIGQATARSIVVDPP